VAIRARRLGCRQCRQVHWGCRVGEDAASDDTCAGLAAKKGAEDPEGAFTSALNFAATLMPPVGEEPCLPDWTADTTAEVPPAGLERVSATTWTDQRYGGW
jgi:hypothetical protein